MATIDELTAPQQQAIIDTDFNTVVATLLTTLADADGAMNAMVVALGNAAPAQTDAILQARANAQAAFHTFRAATEASRTAIDGLTVLIDAVWTSGQAAADAILNPP